MCFYGAARAVEMQTDAEYRYIASNGLPPNGAGDALAQEYVFRMALKPVKKDKPAGVPETMFYGVALDGVPFKTAAKDVAGDANGGVIGADKAYSYATIPMALVNKDLSHLGYAADGFPVFYSKKNLFKSGYDESGKFVDGRGNLDRCNGTMVNNKYYIYVLTGEYPQVPLCWSGTPDPSFITASAQASAATKPLKMPSQKSGADSILPVQQQSQKAFIQENIKRRSHIKERQQSNTR